MTQFDPGDYLDPGEVLHHVWRPSFAVYLRREAFVVTATALAFVPILLWLGDPRVWFILPLIALVDLFVFDNLGDWRRNRGLVWLMTDQRLMQIDQADALETREIALSIIARLRPLLWWRLFVVGERREMINIAYVPALRDVRQVLHDARDSAQ